MDEESSSTTDSKNADKSQCVDIIKPKKLNSPQRYILPLITYVFGLTLMLGLGFSFLADKQRNTSTLDLKTYWFQHFLLALLASLLIIGITWIVARRVFNDSSEQIETEKRLKGSHQDLS
jgi:uncharacterized membrane protein